jgi:hypothetical protein
MDAIACVTGVPTKFDDYPEIKGVLLPNEKGRSDFDMFGRSSRDTPCECETSLARTCPRCHLPIPRNYSGNCRIKMVLRNSPKKVSRATKS